jgi:hypothetical protein
MADVKGHLRQQLITLCQRVQPPPTLAQATRYTTLMVEMARSAGGGGPIAAPPPPRIPKPPVSRHTTPCSAPAVSGEQRPPAGS